MPDLVKIQSISGWEADMYRIFLESLDFKVMIVQESVGQTLGLTIGSLGDAHIYAQPEEAEGVREALRKLEAGEYDLGGTNAAEENETSEPEMEEPE